MLSSLTYCIKKYFFFSLSESLSFFSYSISFFDLIRIYLFIIIINLPTLPRL